MLNNVYKIKKARKDTSKTNIKTTINEERTALDVDLLYRSNNYLNGNKTARVIWITTTQICFELTLPDTLILKQILLINFVLPNNNIIHLQVSVDKIYNNTIIVNHGTYSKKFRTDTSTKYLDEFLTKATWNKVSKVYLSQDTNNYFVETEIQCKNATRLPGNKSTFKESNKNNSLLSFDSKTFSIFDNDALSRFSFIPDLNDGLPSDSVFNHEISILRSKNRKLAELTLISLDGEQLNGNIQYLFKDTLKMFLFIKLLRSCVDYADQVGITDLIVVTNIIHTRHYQIILFEQLATIKTITEGCSQSVTLMHADLNKIRETLDSLENNLIEYLYGERNCQNNSNLIQKKDSSLTRHSNEILEDVICQM